MPYDGVEKHQPCRSTLTSPHTKTYVLTENAKPKVTALYFHQVSDGTDAAAGVGVATATDGCCTISGVLDESAAPPSWSGSSAGRCDDDDEGDDGHGNDNGEGDDEDDSSPTSLPCIAQ